MNTKLYVGNLPFSTTDQELQDLFAVHGKVVSAKVIADRYSGRSRGFGFVEMSTAEEAQQAMSALNGTEVGGRALVVNEARPQVQRRPTGSGFAGASSPPPPDPQTTPSPPPAEPNQEPPQSS